MRQGSGLPSVHVWLRRLVCADRANVLPTLPSPTRRQALSVEVPNFLEVPRIPGELSAAQDQLMMDQLAQQVRGAGGRGSGRASGDS